MGKDFVFAIQNGFDFLNICFVVGGFFLADVFTYICTFHELSYNRIWMTGYFVLNLFSLFHKPVGQKQYLVYHSNVLQMFVLFPVNDLFSYFHRCESDYYLKMYHKIRLCITYSNQTDGSMLSYMHAYIALTSSLPGPT